MNQITRIWLLCFQILSLTTLAQTDSILVEDVNPDLIEDFIQAADEDQTFEFNTLFEDLRAYKERPLDLNKATAEQLSSLQLLSDIQIGNLLIHRDRMGDLISIYELQAVEGFDPQTIWAILPYVTVRGDLDDLQASFKDLVSSGRNELFLRWTRFSPDSRGYLPEDDPSYTGARFEGTPDQFYIRYRHFYSNVCSYGFTAEKDPGEAFFSGSNPNGFDYYSAHFYLRDYNKLIKTVALGDFTASMGQGLILHSGFGNRKSSMVMNIKRSRRALMPYTSVDENNFLRGGGVTLGLSSKLEFTAFGSIKGRDGNLALVDTLDDEQVGSFTSFQISGFHRTPAEIEDENAVTQYTAGGILKYTLGRGHIAVNGLYDYFDPTLNRNLQLYNQFEFNGDRLWNISLDYSQIFKNYHFFGETARSSNGAIATINGLLMSLDRNTNLSILHRYFPADYQAVLPNVFAETTGARNEQGIYLGLETRLAKHWRLAGYADFYRHPWLRFRTDGPSRGQDYRIRLTYFLKRNLEIYAEYRDETKQLNAPNPEDPIDFLTQARRVQVRFHVGKKASKTLQFRTRVDWGFFDDQVQDRQYGISFLQDVIYKPVSFPLSFTTRLALFETDGFDIRFYQYENNLLYNFSVPAYFGRGSRFYFNLRYRGIRNVSLEARYATTLRRDIEAIGAGPDLVNSPRRSEVRAQIRVSF